MTHEEVVAWAAAAIADGWNHKPTYYGDHEAEDRAMSLEKDGWTAMTLTRNPRFPSLSVWAPDRCQITPPTAYSMAACEAAVNVCAMCGQTAPTQRVAFATRVCEPCLPAARKKYEYRGWCD